MKQRHSVSDTLPSVVTEGSTVILVRDNIHQTQVTDEDNNATTQYEYVEYVFTPSEFRKLKEGVLDGGWNETLHHIYRTAQHQRTDDLYQMAQRKARSYDAVGWGQYIVELDEWNDKISALANGFRVEDVPLPAEPTETITVTEEPI